MELPLKTEQRVGQKILEEGGELNAAKQIKQEGWEEFNVPSNMKVMGALDRNW